MKLKRTSQATTLLDHKELQKSKEETKMNTSVNKVGFWSAILVAIFAIIYSVAQIVVIAVPPTPPWDFIELFAPSLFLAWSFIVMMISIHYYASEDRKIYSHIGLTFGVLYAALVSIVYFAELSVAVPMVFRGETYPAWLSFNSPSMLVSIDGLGYVFMALATLFASQVFAGQKQQSLIRWAFFANGLLSIVIFAAVFIPSVTMIGALWIITMPLSAIATIRLFYKQKKKPN
jgi:hypothetical protein